MIRVAGTIAIDESELSEQFVRSGGPGGQNVNKVSTAVELRFDAARSPSLRQDVCRRLLSLAGSRATRDGVIIIDARRFRTREQNRRDAMERLVELIRLAAVPPKPRRATAPTKASKHRRADAKRLRSRRKQLRRRPGDEE